jgi:hypothetical protein
VVVGLDVIVDDCEVSPTMLVLVLQTAAGPMPPDLLRVKGPS